MKKKTFGEKYIDKIMQDGRDRTARQVIEAIIDYIERTPNKVSLAYVPQQRKVSHYLRTCEDYELVEVNTSTGNVFRWIDNDDKEGNSGLDISRTTKEE